MVIKNIPLIVGSDADFVILVDRVPSTGFVDPTSITSGHEVETDDTSLQFPNVEGGALFEDADTFFNSSLGIDIAGSVLTDADTFNQGLNLNVTGEQPIAINLVANTNNLDAFQGQVDNV